MRDDEVMRFICYLAFIIVVIVAAVADCRTVEKECQERGGHVVSKHVYKGVVKFCVSKDGRILE